MMPSAMIVPSLLARILIGQIRVRSPLRVSQRSSSRSLLRRDHPVGHDFVEDFHQIGNRWPEGHAALWSWL